MRILNLYKLLEIIILRCLFFFFFFIESVQIWKALGVPFGPGKDQVTIVWQKETFGGVPDYWEVTIEISQKFTQLELKTFDF
jgi:hypothetical protein